MIIHKIPTKFNNMQNGGVNGLPMYTKLNDN